MSSQPEFGVALPTAGVIMPMVEPNRPWWLVPSLAVGGTLLVAVVALLAVLLLQPTGPSRGGGGDSAPGKAAASGKELARSTAPANTIEPSSPRTTISDKSVTRIAAGHLATAAMVAPRTRPVQATVPESNPGVRRLRKANPGERRHRRVRKIVVKPVRAMKITRPKEPRNRPRSITDIFMDVGKDRPQTSKVPPRAALPTKLGRRAIQSGMSRVMGVARACGRRYSTSGRISVRLVVAGSTGSVLGVSPKGTHAGSLTGRCVARALRSARFKPFATSRQSFYYTVILR